MSAFFSNTIRQLLTQNPNGLDGMELRVAFFGQAPNFATDDPRYVTVTNVAELKTKLGWTEVAVEGYPPTPTEPVYLSSIIQGGSRYVMLPDYPIGVEMAPAMVKAVAFFYNGAYGTVANPLIMVSNTFVGEGTGRVIKGGDHISAQPDSHITGQNNRWMFDWPIVNANQLAEGPLALVTSAPEWEPAHCQHAWMMPQRINMIANPSFEGGINHWRTNGTLSRVDGGMGGYKAGYVVGAAPIIIESNKFPALSEEWTIQLKAQGTGKMRIGLVAWPDTYDQTVTDWGQSGTEMDVWDLSPKTFLHVYALRQLFQPFECQLRIEVQGTEVYLDEVCVETGFLAGWPYFDGDTTLGARDDYSWYGGEVQASKSFSLYYNNKRATAGRLFSVALFDHAVDTSAEELESGMVYSWVPPGTLIEPHWDVIAPGDLQPHVPELVGPITPYKALDPADPNYYQDLGVTNPWL